MEFVICGQLEPGVVAKKQRDKTESENFFKGNTG